MSASAYWELGEDRPSWDLSDLREQPRIKHARAEIFRTVSAEATLIERSAGAEEAAPILSMRFATFNRWTEIDSPIEGHFLERVAPGAFTKSIKENLASIRAILSHGKDPSLGMTVLGKIEAIREEADGATAKVSLFRSVPALLLDGLRAGVYGASFRGDPIKNSIERWPEPSDHNPKGLPEITRTEIRLKDIGPTPFAAYSETASTIGGL